MPTDIMGNTTLSDHDDISVADHSYSTVALPTPLLSFDKSTGWIVAQGIVCDDEQKITRLCWLPVELRGWLFDAHKGMFVIASESNHQLTIIDFQPMLTMLHQSGVIS
jgi:hypothetical protein